MERWIFTAAHELGHLLLHPDAYDVSQSEDRAPEILRLDLVEMHSLSRAAQQVQPMEPGLEISPPPGTPRIPSCCVEPGRGTRLAATEGMMKRKSILVTASALGFTAACTADERDPLELTNSFKQDVAGARVVVGHEYPEARFRLDCEEPAGCDIALSLKLRPADWHDAFELRRFEDDQTFPAVTATLVRPDGFSKTETIDYRTDPTENLSETAPPFATDVSFADQPPGDYEVILTKIEPQGYDALVRAYEIDLSARWKAAADAPHTPDAGLGRVDASAGRPDATAGRAPDAGP